MTTWSDSDDPRGFRLYCLLALFDRRDNTTISDLIRFAREGYERSDPEMGEDGVWEEFDRLWGLLTDEDRIAHANRREQELITVIEMLCTAIEHMGKETKVLDECWYARDYASAVVDGRNPFMALMGLEQPELDPKDLQIDTFRNHTDPAHVRVVHMPTGIAAEASERSEFRSREICLQQIREKLKEAAD